MSEGGLRRDDDRPQARISIDDPLPTAQHQRCSREVLSVVVDEGRDEVTDIPHRIPDPPHRHELNRGFKGIRASGCEELRRLGETRGTDDVHPDVVRSPLFRRDPGQPTDGFPS